MRATPSPRVAATSASHRGGSAGADQGRLRSAAARHRGGRGDGPRRAAAVRGHDHARHRTGADQAVQHLQAAGVQDRRPRQPASPRPTWSSRRNSRPPRCTRPISSRTPASARFDADGQCEMWSSSQGHFQMRALTAQLLGMKIGDIRVYAGGNRRRVRRQDGDLSGAARCAAVEEVRPAGAADDEPRGSVQGLGPDIGFVDVGEDRRQEGRHDRRRGRHLQVPGRRVPRLAGDERLPVRVRAV